MTLNDLRLLKRLLIEADLSFDDFLVLSGFLGDGGVRRISGAPLLSEVGLASGIKPSNMTLRLRSLEKRGLGAREMRCEEVLGGDRRSHTFVLSERGLELCSGIWEGMGGAE